MRNSEKIRKQILLNCEKLETRYAQLTNGRLEEYVIERVSNEPVVGSIYLGRIVNLAPALEAAFVDIGADKNAFLHYQDMLPGADELLEQVSDPVTARRISGKSGVKAASLRKFVTNLNGRKLRAEDIPEIFKPGMEILVEVVKTPIGSKGCRVSTNLSIAGRYLVLLPYSEHIGLSSKIDNASERQRLKNILSELELPEGMGLICRTAGEGRKAAYFKSDLEMLLDNWRNIENAIEKGVCPQEVYREPTLIERTVRDSMTDEIDEIIVDNNDAYKKISASLKKFGGRKMASKASLYKQNTGLFEYYNVTAELEQVYQRHVPLPSGGWICVDETEALIAIDVNTGKSRRSNDQNELVLATNLEAAEEIARQLRLRNVGGLVVIDFIDMRLPRDRDEVYKTMKKLVKDDRAKTRVLPVSKLGLMEMTRQREHESVQDTVFNPCPYCSGTGVIKSPLSMSVEIQRRLNGILKDRRYKGAPVRVIMHPEVLARLKNEDAKLLEELEKESQHVLSFRADPLLHYEEFRFVDPDTGVELQ